MIWSANWHVTSCFVLENRTRYVFYNEFFSVSHDDRSTLDNMVYVMARKRGEAMQYYLESFPNPPLQYKLPLESCFLFYLLKVECLIDILIRC